ncbi:CheR family methyltransferase [Luteolibacter flavescens]|nr:CheR family methyltransferase [Luteolibacter flavescens]
MIEDTGTLFLRGILAAAGLNPSHYRGTPLLRRLPSCLRALRVDSLHEARRLLSARPELTSKALEALLIGTTELFRDPAVFIHLEQEVMPLLLRRPARPRIWSAGCSEGAELYSVGLLLAKLGALDECVLLGSDCRPGALARARQGVYLPGDRSLPVNGGQWQRLSDGRIAMSHELRKAMRWEQSDLLASGPTGTWDLILCRNLAIYLEPASADALWSRLSDALAPGGFLVVGRAEKPNLPGLHRVAPSIYHKCSSSHRTSP